MNTEAIKQQAQNENTPPEVLAKLSKSKDREILRLIASNPNTPVEILEKLGEEFPDEIVANPIFNLLLLENPESRFILLSLARASTTSIEKLEELANHKNILVQQAVVRNSKATVNIIDSVYKNKKLRWSNRAFLENKNTKDNILKEIAIKAGENTKYVYDLILKHPNASKNTIEIIKLYNGYLDASPHALHKLSECKNSKILSLVAIHPNTSIETIKNINSKASREVRENIAKHSKIPEDILHSLANDYYYSVRILIAKREDILERTAMILAQDLSWGDNPGWRIRKEISGNPSVLKSIINSLIEDEHHQVRAAIAEREDISEEQAMILARDPSDYVRKKLADNPHISPVVTQLLNIVNDNWYRERLEAREKRRAEINEFKRLLGLIYNPDTPPETLDRLATNESYSIRQGVAEHPRTKLETLNQLKTDNNINVREKVAANPNISSEIIEELSQDSMAAVRQAIVNNPQTSMTILNKLTSDRSDCVRGAIALRKDISESIALALANDSSAYVRQRLVCNPNISAKILELLSKDVDLISEEGNRSVQIEMIKNVDLSPELFINLASSSSAKVRKEVAKHPKAPLSVLERLKADKDKYVRVEVAKNPNISSEIMEYLATDSINVKPTSCAWRYYSNGIWKYHSYRTWTDYHHQVRMAIARRKDITEKIAFMLSKDPLPQVRWVLAQNINVPLNIVISLCEDSDRKVQDEARKNLSH